MKATVEAVGKDYEDAVQCATRLLSQVTGLTIERQHLLFGPLVEEESYIVVGDVGQRKIVNLWSMKAHVYWDPTTGEIEFGSGGRFT